MTGVMSIAQSVSDGSTCGLHAESLCRAKGCASVLCVLLPDRQAKLCQTLEGKGTVRPPGCTMEACVKRTCSLLHEVNPTAIVNGPMPKQPTSNLLCSMFCLSYAATAQCKHATQMQLDRSTFTKSQSYQAVWPASKGGIGGEWRAGRAGQGGAGQGRQCKRAFSKFLREPPARLGPQRNPKRLSEACRRAAYTDLQPFQTIRA